MPARKTNFHIGEKHNRLTIVSVSHKKGTRYYMNCECECGNKAVIREESILTGHAKSCGCYARDLIPKNKTHGLWNSRTYAIWISMKQRCKDNVKCEKIRKSYTDKCIKVCESWKKFENFYADMGEAPEGLSIDRIDNDKGYSKENCRWATDKEQLNNFSRNRPLTLNGETLNLSQWAEKLGFHRSVLIHRLNRLGWTVEEALTTPRHKRIHPHVKAN